jgi:bidirectional [NiFe] hydrogenase diaphorase subunit
VPACTTPAVAGTKIITKSERLHNLRKATLELLFSERNHFCPMCQYNKGDCGLQHQGYIHGMDSIRYPYLYPALPVDVSAKYFGMDHNRCILCTRCVRTCDEIEGVHTLDVAYRGIRNRVIVDMNQTFAESSRPAPNAARVWRTARPARCSTRRRPSAARWPVASR